MPNPARGSTAACRNPLEAQSATKAHLGTSEDYRFKKRSLTLAIFGCGLPESHRKSIPSNERQQNSLDNI